MPDRNTELICPICALHLNDLTHKPHCSSRTCPWFLCGKMIVNPSTCINFEQHFTHDDPGDKRH